MSNELSKSQTIEFQSARLVAQNAEIAKLKTELAELQARYAKFADEHQALLLTIGVVRHHLNDESWDEPASLQDCYTALNAINKEIQQSEKLVKENRQPKPICDECKEAGLPDGDCQCFPDYPRKKNNNL